MLNFTSFFLSRYLFFYHLLLLLNCIILWFFAQFWYKTVHTLCIFIVFYTILLKNFIWIFFYGFLHNFDEKFFIWTFCFKKPFKNYSKILEENFIEDDNIVNATTQILLQVGNFQSISDKSNYFSCLNVLLEKICSTYSLLDDIFISVSGCKNLKSVSSKDESTSCIWQFRFFLITVLKSL